MTAEEFVDRYKDRKVILARNVPSYMVGMTAIVCGVSMYGPWVDVQLTEKPQRLGYVWDGGVLARSFGTDVFDVIDKTPLPLPG